MGTLISGACIRFTADGPRWHVNSNHAAIGLIDTSNEPFINADGMLEFPLLPASPDHGNVVVSITVAPDETLAARGIIGGGSGGVSSIRVRFSKPSPAVPGAQAPLNLNLPGHYANVQGDTSNAWITLVHVAP